eukprot:1138213-Pelagomonas_calceolata.AAC.4
MKGSNAAQQPILCPPEALPPSHLETIMRRGALRRHADRQLTKKPSHSRLRSPSHKELRHERGLDTLVGTDSESPNCTTTTGPHHCPVCGASYSTTPGLHNCCNQLFPMRESLCGEPLLHKALTIKDWHYNIDQELLVCICKHAEEGQIAAI